MFSSEKKRTADRRGIVILICTFLVFSVVSIFGFMYSHQPPKKISSHTIVLIDLTDPLTIGQQKRIQELLSEVDDSVKTDEKLSIFLLKSDLNGLSEPLFEAVKPPRGSAANPLIQNPRRYEEQFKNKYMTLLEKSLRNITVADGLGDRSPILEALVEVGQRGDFSKVLDNRRLVIISDMLQNTKLLSFYRLGGFSSDSVLNSCTEEGLVASLPGAKVELHILQREEDRELQGDELVKFWNLYFNKTGAEIFDVTKRF